MQWQIKKDNVTTVVEIIGSAISDDRPVQISVGKTKGFFRLRERLQTLHVTESPAASSKLSLEKNFRLRTYKTAKYSHDSESEVYFELVGLGNDVVVCTSAAQVYTPATDKINKRKAAGGKVLRSPITGSVLKIHCNNGDQVKAGDVVLVIEAMKMENKIFAPVSGTVQNLKVVGKDAVQVGQELFSITT